MIGQTIREFEIQSELGSGGYGVVYRAHDTSVDRDVAIKVILPQYASKPEFVTNFEVEARLVAQLEHPHIVPLYTYWHDAKGAFLVMRYIRGGSLRGMLAKQGALPLNKVLRLIEQIADALHTAHEAGVVHRDLKPDNILIDERGNAYLTDFGIAKQLAEENGASATDAIKGTFAYLSPEQIQQQTVSPQTDIYALGLMLYEVLAGKHPYHETPVAMMVMKHLQESLPDIREARDDLSGEIDDIIQKATAKEPGERYATTLDLVADLQQAFSGVSAAPVKQSASAKAKPTTSEERNRYAMLQNVRAFWIAGVLENSLHDAAMIDLGMKAEAGAVDNPWDTFLRTPGGDETVTRDTPISHIFDRMNGKLLILGDPGSGKTTTLLMLARELLHRAELDDQHPIPVVFNLSSWSENQPPLTEWLVDELNGKYQVPRKVATQWVDNDELLLLLDGLDEVAADARTDCVQVINAYRGEHGFVDVVVCSRIKDYEALTGQLKLNGAIVIQPLDDAQIVQYLDALGGDVQVVRELITRDAQLRELAQSPLMLSIMVLAYRGKSAGDVPDFESLEAQRKHLFDTYVQRMFDRRIGEKPYTQQDTLHYLKWLAVQMQRETHSLFQIEDLQPDWLSDSQRKRYLDNFLWTDMVGRAVVNIPGEILLGLFTRIPLLVALIAPTIGGLFASWSIAKGLIDRPAFQILTAVSSALAFIVLVGSGYGLAWGIVAGVGIQVFVILISIVEVSIAQATDNVNPYRITMVETLHFSRSGIQPRIGVIGFIAGCALVVAMGLPFAETALTVGGVLPGIIAGGLVFALLALFASGLTSGQVEMRSHPNQGVRKSLQNARNAFLISFITFILFGIVSIIPISSVSAGLAVGIFFALALSYVVIGNYGGNTVIQHVILRRILHQDGFIPRNFARFLNYAASLILLRKVGGGYIFVHRYLLEYFAGLDDSKIA